MLEDVWMTHEGLRFGPAASFCIKLMNFVVPSPEDVLGLTREKWPWSESVLNCSMYVRRFVVNINYPWCFIHNEALWIGDFTQQFVTISTKVDDSVGRATLITQILLNQFSHIQQHVLENSDAEILTFLHEPSRRVYLVETAAIRTEASLSSSWTSRPADWLSNAETRTLMKRVALLMHLNTVKTDCSFTSLVCPSSQQPPNIYSSSFTMQPQVPDITGGTVPHTSRLSLTNTQTTDQASSQIWQSFIDSKCSGPQVRRYQ